MTTRRGGRDAERYRQMLAAERDAAVLYRAMADADTGERADVFRQLASIEDKHAAHWEQRLHEINAEVPAQTRVTLRTRMLALLARRFSTDTILPYVERAERADAYKYDNEPGAAIGMSDDERGHARQLSRLRNPKPSPREQIGRREPWHRGDRSGALRAAVFGVSDGLVSNAALVMGFAGSGVGRATVVLAGLAGLLAGAFSMAAGEYVSMRSQREMFEREIALEAQELEENPGEERDELALLYRAKGLERHEAEQLADRIMQDREVALDTLAREELGLDPDELGSPWRAAFSSLVTFALGASAAFIPYLFASGAAALVAAIIAVAVALFAVGAGTGTLNGRSAVRSGLRQLAVGSLAAGITYGVGAALGGTVTG